MNKDLLTRADALKARIQDAWRVLELDARAGEIKALEAESAAPDFWSDPERAKRESQKLAELRKEFDGWNTLRGDAGELDELTAIVESEGEQE